MKMKKLPPEQNALATVHLTGYFYDFARVPARGRAFALAKLRSLEWKNWMQGMYLGSRKPVPWNNVHENNNKRETERQRSNITTMRKRLQLEKRSSPTRF